MSSTKNHKKSFAQKLRRTYKRWRLMLSRKRRVKKSQIKQHRQETNRPSKKKISLLRKLTLSANVIAVLVLIYFVVLTSIGPKSIPFVTNKVTAILRTNLGATTSIKNTLLKFTSTGLRLSVIGLEVPYSVPESLEQKVFIIPQIDAEFSLLQLVTANFYPRRLKISRMNLAIDGSSVGVASQPTAKVSNDHLAMIVQILSAVKNGKLPIKSFEIENANLTVRNGNAETKILLRKSQIKTASDRKMMRVIADNRISFNGNRDDVMLNLDCNFSDYDGLKCKTQLNNLVADSIATLHPLLMPMTKIQAVIDVMASFVVKKRQLKNVTFKATTEEGEFDFAEFFGKKMQVKNFLLEGEYDNQLQILNLSKIRTEFPREVAPVATKEAKKKKRRNVEIAEKMLLEKLPYLEMSLLISDIKDAKFVFGAEVAKSSVAGAEADEEIQKNNKKLDFYISLQNVPTNDLEKFWPITLSDGGVRDWVIGHVKDGNIKSAYAKFSMIMGVKSRLESIDSQLAFSGLNLSYDSNFPVVSEISGVAHFDEKTMKITVADGKVLNSRISEGEVTIDDFEADHVFLKIAGKAKGAAVDGLRHVDRSKEFLSKITKYLNGNSESDFAIQIPLSHDATLKNSYINVSSNINDLSNPYLKGAASIRLKKDRDSNVFVSNVDLTAARLELKELNLVKEANVESALDFNLVIRDEKNIDIKKILLTKKEEIKEVAKNSNGRKANVGAALEAGNKKYRITKIFGDLSFEVDPCLLTSMNFTNQNFGNDGKDSYRFSYSFDKRSSLQSLAVAGSRLNLENFLKQKNLASDSSQNAATRLKISAKLGRIDLLRNKFMRNASVALNCSGGFCYNVAIRADYGVGEVVILRSNKTPKENSTTLNGHISDVGYFAEAFGISNVVGGGYMRVSVKNSMKSGKNFFVGEAYIKDQVTIYDNPSVKRLAKNNLFLRVKDKIFSSEKVIFTTVKTEFELYDSKLDLKSLLANNYKIGITAKGQINLKNDLYDIKGKIVPGFIINNLFGIGKIPLLGTLVSGLLTGGEEGGGIFGVRYSYTKTKNDKEAQFETSAVSSFVPTTIGNLFD